VAGSLTILYLLSNTGTTANTGIPEISVNPAAGPFMLTTTQVTSAAAGQADPDHSRSFFIDLLRGIAILLVFLFHALGSSYGVDQFKWGEGLFKDLNVGFSFLLLSPATLGWGGVAIFFAVCGFCIHHSYSKERERGLTRYFIKRTFRIYPP
jgi:peptidoglycan/LPS O-acetylase OafA/YrhL